MQKKWKKAWVEALLSGKYKQATGALIDRPGNKKKIGYCCLGVLAKVRGAKFNKDDKLVFEGNVGISGGTLSNQPSVIANTIMCGLTDGEESELIRMNDEGCTFKQIANYINNKIKDA